MSKAPPPTFAVISGAQVHRALLSREKHVVDLIEAAYRLHGAGDTVNPPSYFLRFPDRPSSRIIALPASILGDAPVDGLKWISSFPSNVPAGLPRASAVLVLNDHTTGYPIACLESSIISAVRTAASAALAADVLTTGRPRPTRIGFFGTGLIARYVHTYLAATGWSFTDVGVYDVSSEHAEGFSGYLRDADEEGELTTYERPQDLIEASDVVVFATVAGTPHVDNVAWFSHNPLVLHVSLRDLSADVILSATNVVDDVEHCLKADTSPHLAEQAAGHRDFLSGTLFDVLTGNVHLRQDRPVIFSPFGLGVLDLALGKYVYDQTAAGGELTTVPDFFYDLSRYGAPVAPADRS